MAYPRQAREANRPQNLLCTNPTPELVQAYRHPLNIGHPERFYSPFDFVGPTIDSLYILSERALGSGIVRRVELQKRRKLREDIATVGILGETARFAVTNGVEDTKFEDYGEGNTCVTYGVPRPGVLCRGCGTTDKKLISISQDGRQVCTCGVEGKMHTYGTDYKELYDTDKSMARGEVFSGSKALDCGLGQVLSKTAVVLSTNMPESARRNNKLGFAQETLVRNSTQESSILDKRHERKLASIIEHVDELASQVGPVDLAIARQLRVDAKNVFVAAVGHHDKCQKPDCQKALFNKPVHVIAKQSFCYTVDQICSGEGFHGISRQKLLSLQQRVRNSQAFNQRDNATQHQSCLAMISALSTSDNSKRCPDADIQTGVQPHHATTLSKGVTFERDVHISRQKSGAQPSLLIQIRDAIIKLTIQHGFTSKTRDRATTALQDKEFAKKIYIIIPDSCKGDAFLAAHVILQSIVEPSKRKRYTSEHLRHVGLSNVDVESMIAKMRDVLPREWSEFIRQVDDDELY